RFHSAMVRRDLAMAAKKAKGDDWFSSLDAELEKKTKEIIEDVGEQNVARLELNKTLTEDVGRVGKRMNKMNIQCAREPSDTNRARRSAELVATCCESDMRRKRDVLIKYLKRTFETIETCNQWTRPRSSDAGDNRRRVYITAAREFSSTWKTCCPALSWCSSSE